MNTKMEQSIKKYKLQLGKETRIVLRYPESLGNKSLLERFMSDCIEAGKQCKVKKDWLLLLYDSRRPGKKCGILLTATTLYFRDRDGKQSSISISDIRSVGFAEGRRSIICINRDVIIEMNHLNRQALRCISCVLRESAPPLAIEKPNPAIPDSSASYATIADNSQPRKKYDGHGLTILYL